MNIANWLLWGFVGTAVLTTILAASQGLGMTRMNIPYLLGTMFTPSRDRAKLIGSVVHLFNGWIFALLYLALFHSLHQASWWLGADHRPLTWDVRPHRHDAGVISVSSAHG